MNYKKFFFTCVSNYMFVCFMFAYFKSTLYIHYFPLITLLYKKPPQHEISFHH